MDARRGTRIFRSTAFDESTSSEVTSDENTQKICDAWAHVISQESAQARNRKVSRAYSDARTEQLSHYKFVFEIPTQEFVGGSKYTGEWSELGFCGYGNYGFPHDVEYEGGLRDGMFHGVGCLKYPMGQILEGEWDNGVMLFGRIKFADGLNYSAPWDYCKRPDRRFYKTIREGFLPTCSTRLTNDNTPRTIPEGCYDTADGFYNPKTKCVMSATDPNKILRVPTVTEEKWILENCRKAWDEPSGYRPDLYEQWITGRMDESEISNSSVTSIPDNTSEDVSELVCSQSL